MSKLVINVYLGDPSGAPKILTAISNLKDILMATLTDLKNAVAAESGVVQSAITLLNGLTAKIQTLIDAGADPAAFQALVDDVKQQTSDLAAGVAANTPAAPPTP